MRLVRQILSTFYIGKYIKFKRTDELLNDIELLKGAAASAGHVTGSEEVAKQTEPLLQPCCAAQRWVPECAPVGS